MSWTLGIILKVATECVRVFCTYGSWHQQHINCLFIRKLYTDLIYWTKRPLYPYASTLTTNTRLWYRISTSKIILKTKPGKKQTSILCRLCLPSKILLRFTHGSSHLSGASEQWEAEPNDSSCRRRHMPWK